MSLVPYALRPRNVLRKAALKHSATGGSVLWGALAMYFVRGPSRLRSVAIRQGVFGGNRKWQAIALLLVLTRDVRQAFGRQPESLGSWTVGTNQFVDVINAKPMSKKELKRSGTTKKATRAVIIASAVAAVSAKNPDAKIVVKSR